MSRANVCCLLQLVCTQFDIQLRLLGFVILNFKRGQNLSGIVIRQAVCFPLKVRNDVPTQDRSTDASGLGTSTVDFISTYLQCPQSGSQQYRQPVTFSQKPSSDILFTYYHRHLLAMEWNIFVYINIPTKRQMALR